MNRFSSTFLAFAAAALAPACLAAGQEHGHGDVAPRVSAGKIVTDQYDDAAEQLTPAVRVFAYEFQESPQDPYGVNDPGFNALPGSGLPVGSRLGVEPLTLPPAAGGATGLAYWDGLSTTGTGELAFGPAPHGETLTLNFLSQNRTLASTGAVPGGFTFGPAVAADGSTHSHLNSILNDGPGASPVPLDGIYLIALRVTSDNPGVAPSEPAYFVFNNGLTELQHDRAVDFVADAIVPEPAGLGVLAIGGAAALFRRRERRCRA